VVNERELNFFGLRKASCDVKRCTSVAPANVMCSVVWWTLSNSDLKTVLDRQSDHDVRRVSSLKTRSDAEMGMFTHWTRPHAAICVVTLAHTWKTHNQCVHE
jgi:hypothetical protein